MKYLLGIGLLVLVAATTWQDVAVVAITAIVTISGIYQVIALAKMKSDIEVIHKTTNSLSEKLLKEGADKATAEATIAERDRVAAFDDKVALAVKDAVTPQAHTNVADNIAVVKKDVSIVKEDVKDVQKKVTKDVKEGIKGTVKKVVEAVIRKKKS